MPRFIFAMVRRITRILLLLLVVAGACGSAVAGTFMPFGPKTYARQSGQPMTVTDTFTVRNPVAQYTLRLINGGMEDDVADFVSSGTITINGVVVVAPSDMNQSMMTLNKPVQLQGINTISVLLHGKPGGKLAVEIIGIDNDLPSISALASPAPNAAGWNKSDVTVSFSCADLTSGILSCPTPVTVSTEGANHLVSGTAVDNAANNNTATVKINLDKTAPSINILSPPANAAVSSASLQISGSVTDTLSGVAQASCNGTAATLQPGQFSCSVLLTAGLNTIMVTAADVAGNVTAQSISVTLSAGLSITGFAPINGPAGTVVIITGTNLTSGGAPQVFLAQQSGGAILAPLISATDASVSFVIPAGASTGKIQLRSGNQSVSSTGVLSVDPASNFSISAGPSVARLLQGSTAAISVALDSANGFGQLATLSVSGLPLGVSASFFPQQITAGQFSILTVTAPVGQTAGTFPLIVTATANVSGIPLTQTATVNLVIQPGATAFVGRILESDTVETPIPGIVIQFLGKDDANNPTGCKLRTSSDAAGNFSFANLPAACQGRQLVWYNGQTSSDGEQYAGVNLAYTFVQGQVTGPEFVHLPRIDNAETVQVRQNWPADQVFHFATIPGITVTVYANTTFTLPNGTQPDPFPFVAVQVPMDRLPDAPVDGPGVLRAFIVAFQPDDTIASQPVSVVWPNTLNTPPGVNMELDTLDPIVGALIKYGTGTVAADGTQIIPDYDPAHPGHRFGIQHFDWHGPLMPKKNAKDPHPDKNSPKKGDPVDLATGIFSFTQTDLAFGGSRGNIGIHRTYRTLSTLPGPFGIGTNHDYGYTLDFSAVLSGGSTLTLATPDGNQFPFIQQPDGTFRNAQALPIFLGASITQIDVGTYVLRSRDGTAYRFEGGTFRAAAALVSITDPNGNAITLTYGGPFLLTLITDPVGRSIELAYDDFGRIISVQDPLGRAVSYTYNNQGTLETVKDAAGNVTTYSYDEFNRVTDLKDPRGIVFLHNDYDENGMVRRQITPDGAVTQFSYTLLNPNATVSFASATGEISADISTSPVLVTAVTDPRGNKTVYHFNETGFLVDVTDPVGAKTIYNRAPDTNLVTSMVDPLGRVSRFEYDATGNRISTTFPAGTSNAATTRFSYDPVFSKLTSIIDPLGHATSMAYDPAGNLISVSDDLQHGPSYTYDEFGELTAIADFLGNKMLFSYANGNMTAIKDPVENETTLTYDVVGRLVSTTTPAGQITLNAYDALNQRVSTTDPLGGITRFEYDPNGNLLSITDAAGRKTSYSYDMMDRVSSVTDPLQRPQQLYSYDLAGNLVRSVDWKGQAMVVQYDALNQPVFIGFGGNGTNFESTESSEFDVVGRLTRVVDSASGVISMAYDLFDQIESEISPQGAITYSYDAAGRRSQVNVVGQPPIQYQYDNVNRLTALSQSNTSISFGYDVLNRRTSSSLPNGVSVQYSFDPNSRVTGISYQSGATTLGNLSYSYDAQGQRSRIGGTFARVSLPAPLAAAVYNAGNELMSWDGTSFSYDANGNMLSDGTRSYAWNARDQLASVNGIPLQYDAMERRILNPAGSSFLFDGDNAATRSSGGNSIENFLLAGDDEVLAATDPSGTTVPIRDALGSTLALVDATGAIKTTYTYEPFGATSTAGQPNTNPFQFTGRENDGNGLYYFRARYYNPAIARFISEDPLGFEAGENFYVYGADDPVLLVDRSGMEPCKALITAQDNARRNEEFQPKGKTTFCNTATLSILEAVGAPTEGLVDSTGTPLKANAMIDALEKMASNNGAWVKITGDSAQKLVMNQRVALGGLKNLSGDGHVATVRPDSVPGDTLSFPGGSPDGNKVGPLFNNIGKKEYMGIMYQNYAFPKTQTPTYYAPKMSGRKPCQGV